MDDGELVDYCYIGMNDFKPLDMVYTDPKFDFTLPTTNEDIETILSDPKFQFGLPETKLTAQWYYDNFPGFPTYFYPILAECSGAGKCDRHEIRKIVKAQKKQVKKIKQRNKKILLKYNEQILRQNTEELPVTSG